ncbi:MAG: helix-turn-helix transcriptional regulator [Prevotella histicola]|uniref:Helix-turn-helix transcriptional regulator n=1 Tax=Prevotella histicola TaxID=470565 RepID=A0A930I151_9BACT|nr:helix-turn-helix transcriptional regulator [Prevotella histicola]
MEETVKDRLTRFRQYKKLGQGKFEKLSGLSNGYLTQLRKAPGSEKLQRILCAFPELNRTWLLTGEGDMLDTSCNSIEDSQFSSCSDLHLIPLLPVSAQGGSLNDFVVSIKESSCEKIISPIKGADYAMSVSGESMAPEYPSGSQILIKRINEKAFIDWGRVYVLDTCNGTVIKRLFPSDTADKVLCKSINPEFPPFEVLLSDVYAVYRVLMCMSLK